MTPLRIMPVTPDNPGFALLKAQSIAENFNMLRRLEANWLSGDNRFNAPGEKLLGIFSGEALVGVGGLNLDPFSGDDRAGRIRHLYVSPMWRGRGVGKLLLQAIVADGDELFDFYNTHAPQHAFRFYEAAGFEIVSGEERVTHRLII
ncbi:Acetyltransferase (GNAT) family [Cedecea lapagei]|uniref:Acetyltransferase (GNAT) family n=1 Tax=Cedecea lapagei TaxID=158823 RepID=A0A3S4ME70_9ENTR|nr:GNAT family N-acetyltransferase [Cedecea lapagei]VEB96301.1 Acetyltransferase (GNAT) family [Cedecea lapagei]